MQLDLDGKKALITGASRGIGQAIARALHEEGCQIAINARGADGLMAVAAKLPGVVLVPGDVTKPTEAAEIVRQTASALGGLDILVCNVGDGRSVPPGEETPEEWQRVFAVNLFSATNAIEAARKALTLSRGTIVCVSSICGLEVIPGAPVTYSVAKAALNAYVRGMASPLGCDAIRINAVAPGNILFDGSVWSRRLQENPREVRQMLDRDVPLKEFGKPEDVAELVAFLASRRARFTTGTIWTLDGGQTRS